MQLEPLETSLEQILRSSLKSQFHGALAMLGAAIEMCPDDEWVATSHGAPFWRVTYHALFYTHLYLERDDTDFHPWESHQSRLEHLDDIPGPPNIEALLEPPNTPPQTGVPLSKAETLAYWRLCDARVDSAIDAVDLLAPCTGFCWHTPQRPKVEHLIASIRHIQHHASQLAVRVREATGEGVDWVGSSRTASPETEREADSR